MEEDFFDDNKKPRFEDILTDMQSNIILDVGGSRFKVSMLTWKKTNSLLTNIEKVKPLPGSASVPTIFIARDPTFFLIILNFIRNGEIKDAILQDDIAILNSLDYECEFFRLQGYGEVFQTNWLDWATLSLWEQKPVTFVVMNFYSGICNSFGVKNELLMFS